VQDIERLNILLHVVEAMSSLSSFLPHFSKVYRIFIFLGGFDFWGKILLKLLIFGYFSFFGCFVEVTHFCLVFIYVFMYDLFIYLFMI
jgi:hypothetical protein